MAPVVFLPGTIHGAAWVIIAPSLTLAISIAFEVNGFPALLGQLVISVYWLGSFLYLFKKQYGRRERVGDVVVAFILSTTLGLLLLSIVVVLFFDLSGLELQQ